MRRKFFVHLAYPIRAYLIVGPIKMSKDGSLKKAASKPKMIKVTKLPPETTEENITLFFENTRRSGGGDVENVDLDLDNGTAIVTFAEEDGKINI